MDMHSDYGSALWKRPLAFENNRHIPALVVFSQLLPFPRYPLNHGESGGGH